MREKYLLECFVVLLVIACNISLTSSLKKKERPCKPNGSCQCIFPNGSALDLTKLINRDFGWIKVNETADITYRPCVDVKIGNNSSTNECYTGVSVCLRNNQTVNETSYVNLGKASDGKFSSTKASEPISLHFQVNNRPTATVTFKCSENPNDAPSLEATENAGNYVIVLTSPETCITYILADAHESGLSGGSLLVLIFIVLSATYFGGGILTLKLIRGAEGKEMIPNYEFWADLPYLVRDGVIFTLSGFQPSPSYDRI
ncbi:uncharacterized protein LOC142319520 [Lycorma delicatula]|uniref:uncharacterized protein LOC142319520 n=1 Tax=Lycorma delicatula TaxID=130591 RepID=UPI003F51244E